MTDSDILPYGLDHFLRANGLGDAVVEPIPGDASARRYFRLRNVANEPSGTAMLMHAPPPEEDPQPFLHAARWLSDNGLRAPRILAEDAGAGWLLTEDFGTARMRDWLDANPAAEAAVYAGAVDALVDLHRLPAGPFAPYDAPTYARETGLFTEWFIPRAGLDADVSAFQHAWRQALAPVLSQGTSVTVLRDYHAENIMLLGPQSDGTGPQGLLDFQDALAGHRAYDLVSLLQDARRDVSPALEQAMLAHYAEKAGLSNAEAETFMADYAVLGAQRNTKIVGIFTRLAQRDGKARYLDMIPRVWDWLERDLEHPALVPVARWFDANVPADLRAKRGRITE